jgi:type IV pilus assembly protein PilC
MTTFVARYVDAGGKPRTVRFLAQDGQSATAKAEAEFGPLISLTEENPFSQKGHALPFSRLQEFTALVSVLLGASLSLKDALDIGAQTSSRKDVRALCASLSDRIGKGLSFSQAMAEEGKLPPVYTGLVAVGERTATLPACLARLDIYLKEGKELRDATSGALAYPIIVLITATIGIFGVGAYALPKLKAIFSELGVQAFERFSQSLKTASLSAIALSAFLGLAALATIIIALLRNRGGGTALAIDRALLSLPFARSFISDSCMLDFSFAMESLYAGGFPLDVAIPEAAKTSRNAFFATEAMALRDELRKGARLSKAMTERKAFPAYAAQWVAVGERTGDVAGVFGQLKGYYIARAKKRSQSLLRILEPAMSAIIGAMVLYLVFAFVVPLFEAMGSMLPTF